MKGAVTILSPVQSNLHGPGTFLWWYEHPAAAIS